MITIMGYVVDVYGYGYDCWVHIDGWEADGRSLFFAFF